MRAGVRLKTRRSCIWLVIFYVLSWELSRAGRRNFAWLGVLRNWVWVSWRRTESPRISLSPGGSGTEEHRSVLSFLFLPFLHEINVFRWAFGHQRVNQSIFPFGNFALDSLFKNRSDDIRRLPQIPENAHPLLFLSVHFQHVYRRVLGLQSLKLSQIVAMNLLLFSLSVCFTWTFATRKTRGRISTHRYNFGLQVLLAKHMRLPRVSCQRKNFRNSLWHRRKKACDFLEVLLLLFSNGCTVRVVFCVPHKSTMSGWKSFCIESAFTLLRADIRSWLRIPLAQL